MSDPYVVSLDAERLQMDRIHAWLRETYWSPRIRRDVTEKAFQKSLAIGVYREDTGDQVAVARVVTDFATFAWLCDVYVDEPHRKRGLTRRMVETLESLPEFQTLRRWVLATQTAAEVYERLGYEQAEPGRFLIKRNHASAWQEPAE